MTSDNLIINFFTSNPGVPKLDRSEVEVACEEFSNIVACMPHCNVYKGTLSSKVEIAVSSTLITSVQDWSKDMEIDYRKQVCFL